MKIRGRRGSPVEQGARGAGAGTPGSPGPQGHSVLYRPQWRPGEGDTDKQRESDQLATTEHGYRGERMQPHRSNALRYAFAALEMRTAGCTVGAPLKRRCQKPQGRA